MTRIPLMAQLAKYLGVAVLAKRVSKPTFDYILDNMRRKLITWKANALSLIGYLMLVQSTLSMVPMYTMQALAISEGICSAIDKNCMDFLWGGKLIGRKSTLSIGTKFVRPTSR